jgi:hypothetical protein
MTILAGAQFEILVDGANPRSEVKVRDLQSGK